MNMDMDVIDLFEQTISKYSGSKYGIAVSSCTNAIFLSLQYLISIGELKKDDVVTIPTRTYLSVPCSIKNSGLNINFQNIKWSGMYQLKPCRIWDSAVRFTKDMFVGGNNLQCLSFQDKKILKLGRGGMIITNDKKAMEWLKKARFNGKNINDNILEFCGWNMYMTPETAARGISQFNGLNKINSDCGSNDCYIDLSKIGVFNDE